MNRSWLVVTREQSKLSHDDVANLCGITRQYYGMIEAGLRNPSVLVAKRIAEVLNCDWTLFFSTKGNILFRDDVLLA